MASEPDRDPLAEYKRKRDFRRTPEPVGAVAGRKDGTRLRFVIQKHAATTLHYDLRLECDGVMKSWAVPKGLSADPADKRLAMEVEDHPMEYNTFEGTIPRAEYGGGTVLLWDRGTFYPDEAEDDDPNDALRREHAAGKISFFLEGERLRGSFALVRTDAGAKPKWLVIKHRDRFAKPGFDITEAYPTSVETGRTLEEIAADKSSETWSSDAIAPMTAMPSDTLPRGRGWVFERRYAGTRLHAYATPDAVRLLAHGRDVTRRMPELAARLRDVATRAGHGFVLDGIVADDADGTLHAFDLLFDGNDILIGEPWQTRRDRLEALLDDGADTVALAAVHRRGGKTLLERARREQWSGIVAKRIDSAYRAGEEAEEWIEVRP